MKFLSLLLGLVIFVAILYQGIFTPAVSNQPTAKQQPLENSAAMQTLKQAQELKHSINQMGDKNYHDNLKNH